MNARDSEVVCGILARAGYQIVNDPETADAVIFNTCSVRQHAEDKVWSEVGRIAKVKRQKAKGKSEVKTPLIGIIGCMAQNYQADIFKRAPAVDFVVGPSDIDKIPGILDKQLVTQGHRPSDSGLFELKIWETDGKIRPQDIYHTGFREDKDHAYVVISEGCSNYCSYCVVPYVRGELHNRDYKDILKEIKGAVEKGITSVTLLGQSVNAYISEEGVDFVKLLRLVDEINGLKEFSFITSHPKDTSEELFEAMASCIKLKKLLHLPVQSGSDRILKLMNRGYVRQQYLNLIEKYRKIVPCGMISTDIIVGFPTEIEGDFLETFDLMKEIKFNSAYIFKYSPRPRTRAQGLADDVTQEEKERRHKILLDYQKGLSKPR